MAVTGFFAELSNLKQLYFISIKGQQLLGKHINSMPINERHNDIFPDQYSPAMNTPDYTEVKSFIRKNFGFYLRETIFVRIISAIEVLLIDSATTIFISDKKTLRGKKIDLSLDLLTTYNDINQLWAKIIKDETRNLNGRKLSDIVDYYSSKFNINLREYSSLNIIEEMFERRHLLVHTLGQTDEIYRKKYSFDHSLITVDENYLLNCFDIVGFFYEYLRRAVYKRVNINSPSDISIRKYQISLRIGFFKENVSKFFDPQFSIKVNRTAITLSEITLSKSDNGNEISLVLSGERIHIGKYIEIIKKLEHQKKLKLISRDTISRGHRTKLSNDQLQIIYNHLGERPLRKNISAEVALLTGHSKTQISHAISYILDHEELFI